MNNYKIIFVTGFEFVFCIQKKKAKVVYLSFFLTVYSVH